MKQWTVTDQKEFADRQGCFEFGDACRFVMAVVIDVKKRLTDYVKRLFPKVKPNTKRPHQLVLELDGLAQIP